MSPTPKAINENPTPAAVLPKEVGDAVRTENQVRKFSAAMVEKMHRHQGRFEPWNERAWNKKELDLAIANSVLDCDYESVANYAMIASALQDANGSNSGLVDGEVCGTAPIGEKRGG